LNETADSLPAWPEVVDVNFNAQLAMVNAELFSILRLWSARVGKPLSHRQTLGAVGYIVRAPSGRTMLVDVLQRTEQITTVRFSYPEHLSELMDDELMQDVEPTIILARSALDIGWFQRITNRCIRQVEQVSRYSHPDFNIDPNVLTPAVPRWDSNDEELQRDAIRWKNLYRPTMPDREFAALLGIDDGTLRNARSRLEVPVRSGLDKALKRTRRAERKTRDKK
jgi:hypothetical protein